MLYERAMTASGFDCGNDRQNESEDPRAELFELRGRKPGNPPQRFVSMQIGKVKNDKRILTRVVPVARLADG